MATKIQFFIAALASAQEKFSTKMTWKLLINKVVWMFFGTSKTSTLTL